MRGWREVLAKTKTARENVNLSHCHVLLMMTRSGFDLKGWLSPNFTFAIAIMFHAPK